MLLLWGQLYPGALSAWLKLKYPSSIAGAVSSSAPYHAEANFGQYAQVVGSALKNPAIGGSDSCFDAVEEVRGLPAHTISEGPHNCTPAVGARHAKERLFHPQRWKLCDS